MVVTEYPLFRLRRFFYLIHPSEVAYESIEQLPDLSPPVDIAAALFVLEYIVAWMQRKHKVYYDVTDCYGALISYLGFLLESSISHFTSLHVYDWIHRNYALVYFPDPASPWLFLLSMLAVDFFRYWQHRLEHEIELLWEQHKVHHSSEYVNQFSVLRYSNINVFPMPYHWPMAFVIPPTHYYVHIYLNIICKYYPSEILLVNSENTRRCFRHHLDTHLSHWQARLARKGPRYTIASPRSPRS